MKLCYLAPANSPHSYRWIEFFAARGHEVHWITLDPPLSRPGPPIRLHEFSRRRSAAVTVGLAARGVRRLLANINPDLLHVHSAATYGLVAGFSGFHPAIITAWGSDVLMSGKSTIQGPFVRFALSRADAVTCDALHLRQAVCAMGVEPHRVHDVNFGVDTTVFRPRKGAKDLREKLAVGDDPLVLSLRSLDPIYDLATLVRAIPRILRSVPRAKVLIAGGGAQDGALRRMAAQTGIDHAVRFLGPLDYRDLPSYIGLADVYVSTALSDGGLAASTAEAMACGLPVVVTDTADNRLWVRDGENGKVVPPGDPPALAAALTFLLEAPSLERRRMGVAGRSVIELRNNHAVEMQKMEGIYEQVAQAAVTATPPLGIPAAARSKQ